MTTRRGAGRKTTRGEADTTVQAAQAESAAARTAQTRAEAAQQEAEHTSADAQATVEQLRAELETLRADNRAERDQLRAEHHEQLADLRMFARTAEQRAGEHRDRADRAEAALTGQRALRPADEPAGGGSAEGQPLGTQEERKRKAPRKGQ